LALLALVAVVVTQLVIARQMQGALEARIGEMLEARIELLRERAERGQTIPSDQLERLLRREGQHAHGDNHRHDVPPEVLRSVGQVRVVPLDELDFDEATEARVVSDEIVQTEVDEGRVVVARIDDNRAIVVGPGRRRLPPAMLLHQAITLMTLLAVIGLGLWWLQRPIEAKLARLADTARALAAGDRGARSGVRGADAVGEVGEQFDAMADSVLELLARREELLRSVSHELRTPLARLALLHERAVEATDGETRQSSLERMRRSLDEMTRLVEELLEFSRIDAAATSSTAPMAVDGVVRECVAELDENTLVVQVDAAAARTTGDPALLQRAVGNVVRNAARHARSRIVVRVERVADRVTIDVDDDGGGVDEADRARVFEPFVRLGGAKDSGGSGLGLAIARRSVEKLGGTLVCEASHLGGARFRISLPTAG
jgi:signal transduction histidine kinase